MCKVWKIEPHNIKSLARRETSTKGQGTIMLSSSGNKKGKAKVKGKAQGSANALDIMDLLKLLITSSEPINISCYETVKWFLDSGCTDHITSRKSDFIQYRELGQTHNAKIADRKYLTIEGYGTVIRHSIMLNGTASLQI